ncbi:MAG: response regulator transcription factor [Verrucomicrobiota bacterium]
MAPYNVVLVDDDVLLRDLLRSYFEFNKQFEVVRDYSSGRDLIDYLYDNQPDLIILDLMMPDMNGRLVYSQIKLIAPEVPVMILSSWAEAELVTNLLASGIRGVIQKGVRAQDVLSAAKRVVDGGIAVETRGESATLRIEMQRNEQKLPLTNREKEIVQLVASGRSSKDIATVLSISVRTVEKHRENCLRKLGANDMSALVRYAMEQKLIAVGS